MLDATLTILIAAAVAFSAVQLIDGPLMLRALTNQRAVTRWLVAGLDDWGPPPATLMERFGQFLFPGAILKDRSKSVMTQLGASQIVPPEVPTDPTKRDAASLERQLFTLATGGGRAALYRLESEQFAAQINAASEAVLDRPRRHALLLIALAKLGPREVLTVPGPPSAPTLSQFLQQESTIINTKESSVPEARHELTLRVQRRLDDLQITTRSYQQIVDQALYVGVATIAAAALDIDPSRIVSVGILAGFVAPLIGRTVSAPQR